MPRRALARVLVLCLCLALALPAGAQEPSLPPGLAPQEDTGPDSTGTQPGDETEEPALPAGLGGAETSTLEADNSDALPFTGFLEGRIGRHLDEQDLQRTAALAEARLQLESERQAGPVLLTGTVDFVLDALADDRDVDFRGRETSADVRQANAQFTPHRVAEAKLGRQIQTWGTGDLLFLNDLFPKDFNAFIIGRDIEYLKAPSDALRLSLFGAIASLNLVYTPRFDPDRFIDGRRVSFFDPARGRIVGRDVEQRFAVPDDWLGDDEWAARLFGRYRAYELALYGYDGFWKSPAGSDATGAFTFPRLRVFGASMRGPLGSGIANGEVAYYNSRDDRGGGNAAVRNSEFRALAGYTQELIPDLTLGTQYYIEAIRDYGALRRAQPAAAPLPDEHRHVVTLRLTWLTHQQNVEWSLFAFYSPSDEDGHLRPRAHYKIDDHWSAEAGANLFFGRKDSTFFGQLQDFLQRLCRASLRLLRNAPRVWPWRHFG